MIGPPEPRPAQADKLGHLQPSDGPGTAAETVGLNTEALEHGDIKITERGVVLGVEGEVLAVSEAAAGEEGGHVGGGVGGGVAEVAPIKEHRAVEEGVALLFHPLEAREKGFEFSKLGFLDGSELSAGVASAALMCQRMMREGDAGKVDLGIETLTDEDGDQAGAVGF